ncbi:cytochrome c-553 [Fulvimarina pelagi HTCC2506]|uniref:Cytochrome c-553 n=1 Tax=Fulvimarina pelagi HTCC2506 TaxID=314231 RepID=Q0G4T4_9HYPH|nr:cytochrome c [Fulvimarina pelagi]EAU43330.1 cytochrome c-553 [Fulvimarina pelagi HTCC2506]
MKRALIAFLTVALVVAGVGWLLTAPSTLDAAILPNPKTGNAERGELVFWAGGCASCHADGDAEEEEKLRLGGGDPIESDFGTFYAPNISPDPDAGIGNWSFTDFANAMKQGVSPDGQHYYPAFPYSSYARILDQDLADLWAFLQTLPAVADAAPDNEIPFPFNIRRGVGVWKFAFLDDASEPIVALPEDAGESAGRGRYLVEALGHCGQCHTPRSFMGAGGMIESKWLAGGPNPDGDGRIPNITSSEAGVGSWSESDLAYYFESGFTPDFDSVGGSMVDVQENLAQLPAADREAIAAYLKAVPPIGAEAE